MTNTSIILYTPMIVSLIGLIIYFALPGKRTEAPALHAFWVGLLVALFHLHK